MKVYNSSMIEKVKKEKEIKIKDNIK